MPARLLGALAVAAVAALAAGCGGDDDQSASGPAARALGGSTLAYALAGPVGDSDPLLARSRSDEIVARQIHEPLVASLSAPFGSVRRSRGLAIAWHSTQDREIWSFRLRSGIRFEDGTPFNAAAVLANAQRWRTLAPGRALLPDLVAVDAPRPDLVRFILSRPVRDLPERLASPRLGIVSPRALRPHNGTAARLAQPDRSGTGPFELREAEAGGQLLLAANTDWWGARLDLGPALDQIRFEIAPRAGDRLAMLESGDVQVADELDPGAIRRLRADPLLTYVAGSGGAVVGLQRSVRGIDSATAIEPLSNVWLTVVGVG
jgi:peptide/nickel transport system substrate-binding protein